jgi:NAD(P)-dependent dehydrogenase (short-subunit alcohol dehydrogenase family)
MGRVRVADRVAIVTGGGGQGDLVGVGRATCRLLAREGARIVVVDQSEAAAAVTVEEINSEGGEALAVVGDVGHAETSIRATEMAMTRFGRLNILVNSASIIGPSIAAEDPGESGWDQVMAVNAKGSMLMAKHSASKMEKGSSIINIGSISAMRSSNRMAYAASKGAIASMTIVMAAHYGKSGIRVNCVVPGLLWAPMVAREMTSQAAVEAMRQGRVEANFLGQEGTAWDVAMAVLFFSSDDSKWITGQSLLVDGGVTVARPAPQTAT